MAATKLESFQTYKDLRREISLLTARTKGLERERKHLLRMMHVNAPKDPGAVSYDQERVTSSFHVPSLVEIVPRLNEIKESLGYLYDILHIKEQTKREMEKTISTFEGLDYKVANLRMQGMSLTEIADKLGYSDDYIRKVSSRLKKAHFRHKILI
jgi:hypothetical protein